MKFKKFYLLIIFFFTCLPSEVISHPGSRRYCAGDPNTFRLSNDFSKSVPGEEPWWKGVPWSGGNQNQQAKQYSCMHSGLEKHRKSKGSHYCHYHIINDRNWPKSRQWWTDAGTENRGGYSAKCRKTG